MSWAKVDGKTKFDHPPVRSLARGLRSQFENWWILGALSFAALPSRFPPRRGSPTLARMTVDVRMKNGLRARCRLNEFVGFVEVWVYEEYAVPGLDWTSVRTIVDVGANVGAATLWFASRAPNARIVAVEPAPTVVPTLKKNVERNGLDDRVQIVPKALGATPGIGFLTPEADSTRTSLTMDPGTSTSAVPVESLQGSLEESGIGTLDLLKLDCEGAEFDILRASAESILPSIRAIVGEFHATETNRRGEIERILVRSGFDCQFVGPEDSGLFAAIQRQPER